MWRESRMLESDRFMSSRNTDHPLVIFKNAFPGSVIGMMVLQVGVINGALVLGGVLAGIFLDRQLGTRPALTLTLGILGAIAAGVLTFWVAMRTVRKARAAYLDYEKKRVETTTVPDAQAKPAGSLG
jgi:F0F1-type ATP synthase assembly protein I